MWFKKNDKHRTNDLIDSNGYRIVELDRMSPVFHYLTRMQDEVHRYTISYHRTIRSKGAISSVLDHIHGIGDKRKKELIKEFGSITKIKNASIDDLKKILPEDIAIRLQEYLREKMKKRVINRWLYAEINRNKKDETILVSSKPESFLKPDFIYIPIHKGEQILVYPNSKVQIGDEILQFHDQKF